jgi:hypothetical protein
VIIAVYFLPLISVFYILLPNIQNLKYFQMADYLQSINTRDYCVSQRKRKRACIPMAWNYKAAGQTVRQKVKKRIGR